jgi:folate-binding protein YgfZ
VTVSGPDAGSFLQGQLTNDVDTLAEGAVQLSGYCSPKGRLLASFPLASIAPTQYLLVVPADIAAGFVRRLRMFVVRAKVVVAALDTSPLIGRTGPGAGGPFASTVEIRETATMIGLPDGRIIAVCPAENATGVWNGWSGSAVPVGSPVWDAIAIRAGVPVVTAATQDKFVPQMLNWELLGGVSFRKGCYTGQEIVARMQYLGRLKERLYRGHTAAVHAEPGAPLFGEQFGEQACGTIVNTAPSAEGGTDILAVLQIASAERDKIRFAPGGEGAVLELQPMPYDVPRMMAAQGS